MQQEADLIRSAKRGDAEAQRVLLARHATQMRPRVQRQLSRAVLRKVSVADVFQEACVVALNRLADFEYRGDGSFGRWLGRIVDFKTREVIERYVDTAKRRVDREVTRNDRRDTAHLAGAQASPSQEAIASELRARIAVAMQQITPDQRTALSLLQQHGLTVREAAERMRRSPNAVKKLYARGVARLQQLLGIEP